MTRVTWPRPAARTGALRAQAGMTLIEVLIALAILAFMMSMAWTTMSSTAITKKRFEHLQDRNHEIRVAMNIMAKDLASAYLSANEPIGASTDNPRTIMVGKRGGSVDELRFSSLGHRVLWADATESEQTLIAYLSAPDAREPGKINLLRRESRRLSNEPWESEPADVDILLRDIEGVSFEYFDWRDNDWQESWDTTKADAEKDRLPERVRITVTLRDEHGREIKRTTQARIAMMERLQILHQ